MNPGNSTNFRNVNGNGDWNNNNATNTNYVFPDFLHFGLSSGMRESGMVKEKRGYPPVSAPFGAANTGLGGDDGRTCFPYTGWHLGRFRLSGTSDPAPAHARAQPRLPIIKLDWMAK